MQQRCTTKPAILHLEKSTSYMSSLESQHPETLVHHRMLKLVIHVLKECMPCPAQACFSATSIYLLSLLSMVAIPEVSPVFVIVLFLLVSRSCCPPALDVTMLGLVLDPQNPQNNPCSITLHSLYSNQRQETQQV